MDEARAELGLRPGDLGREIQATLRREPLHAKALAEEVTKSTALRSLVERQSDEKRDLERRLAALEQQPRDVPQLAQAELVVPSEPAELRRLRSKIDDLQAMIRERNETIAELREQLAAERSRSIDLVDGRVHKGR
jgi:hypothetical protein